MTVQSTFLTRRAFATGASLTALTLCSARLRSQISQRSPVGTTTIQVEEGKLLGEQFDEIRVFRGVPFAAPPTGALRFKPPVQAKVWTGIRDATQFASAPMQPGRTHIAGSEDCLYLNIWAPQGKGPYPVLVWIHGGGFTGGSSFSADQDGTKFAGRGIVCVTVEYRLGVFGFLDLEPLLGEGYAGSANNGLRDLVAALEWIQRNIVAFGGDPSRVTVGGQSAGAKLTDTLMGTPGCEHLFQQMISESGGADRVWPTADAGTVADGFGRRWVQETKMQTSDLTTAAADQLITIQRDFTDAWPRNFPLRPELEPGFLPRMPVEQIRAGATRGKRLLIGTNLDESAFFLGPHPEQDPVANQLGNLTLSQFNPILRRYGEVYPEMTPAQLRIRAVTAEEYWIPSVRVADAQVHGGGKAWMYRLDFLETSGKMPEEAYHSLDLGLVWDEPHERIANADAEATLAAQVHTAWVEFIHGSPPAAPGLPAWPEYLDDQKATMLLNVQSRVEDAPHTPELRLWNGLL